MTASGVLRHGKDCAKKVREEQVCEPQPSIDLSSYNIARYNNCYYLMDMVQTMATNLIINGLIYRLKAGLQLKFQIKTLSIHFEDACVRRNSADFYLNIQLNVQPFVDDCELRIRIIKFII